MDGFRCEMLKIHQRIKALQNGEFEELSDEDYGLKWYENNDLYKWYLIRMEQWMGDKSCPCKTELYEANIQAQRIGQRTGYYWNKVSKKLFELVECGII